MPQIYDMGPTALLFPSEGRRAEDSFALKIRRFRPGLNPGTWVLKASTLPLDHRTYVKKELFPLQCTDNPSFHFDFKVLIYDAMALTEVAYISGLYYLT